MPILAQSALVNRLGKPVLEVAEAASWERPQGSALPLLLAQLISQEQRRGIRPTSMTACRTVRGESDHLCAAGSAPQGLWILWVFPPVLLFLLFLENPGEKEQAVKKS